MRIEAAVDKLGLDAGPMCIWREMVGTISPPPTYPQVASKLWRKRGNSERSVEERPAPVEVELTPAPDSTTWQPHRGGRGVADHAARFTCTFPDCGKAYLGPDRVRKHCRVHHPEWLNALGEVGPAGYCSWEVSAERAEKEAKDLQAKKEAADARVAVRDSSKTALKAARAEEQAERRVEQAERRVEQAEDRAAARRHNSAAGWVTADIHAAS